MRVAITAVTMLLLPAEMPAQQAVWDSVGRVLQSSAVPAAGYVRFNFPRRDLTLKMGDNTVSRLALGAWAGFTGNGKQAMVMGDLVVTLAELLPVEAAIDSQHLAILGVHNHLTGESPTIMYVHFHGDGSAVDLARRLDRVLAKTLTPRGVGGPATSPVTIDTAQVFAALGAKGTASGAVAQVGFVLIKGNVVMRGDTIPPALAAGSPVNVQAIAPDRYVATGDFAVFQDRVQPVISALTAHGITATAVHNHLQSENPPIYFIHFWADGSPGAVLAGIKAALDAGKVP
ncbi:MAG TPA: DUF1259 domain-containing protein [Gemmatimonadales bacterium]|nr:DUF1259 domain-containing protein [Gemmatimonadales bacterium]